ncbi:hypothetical protein BJY00DRAFT_318819 [Aspergillus carlsbadensis]|nr:hypothetical protein BJY00DRAFT_318819 [Aspergillus carlsbadensis]
MAITSAAGEGRALGAVKVPWVVCEADIQFRRMGSCVWRGYVAFVAVLALAFAMLGGWWCSRSLLQLATEHAVTTPCMDAFINYNRRCGWYLRARRNGTESSHQSSGQEAFLC